MLTLLQARYSERGYWLVGREAFSAAHARLGKRSALAAAALRVRPALAVACRVLSHASSQRCAEELDEGDEEAAAPAPRRTGALFEGQLGLSGPADAPAAPQLPPELAALLGGDDGFVGLEEALAASLQAPQRTGPPPASRAAVAALRVEHITAQRLAELGPGVQCAVCRCELAEGDDVQLLPCSDSHAFHAPCLAPWLAEHNSCPVCRHELPTDDWRYEERKERAQADAEDAKGAANALRGGEFIWL
jgi:hypothetical protein